MKETLESDGHNHNDLGAQGCESAQSDNERLEKVNAPFSGLHRR